jgi:hypothetical protein
MTSRQREVWRKVIEPFEVELQDPDDRIMLRVAALKYAIDYRDEGDPDCMWNIFASCYENYDYRPGIPMGLWNKVAVQKFYDMIQGNWDF